MQNFPCFMNLRTINSIIIRFLITAGIIRATHNYLKSINDHFRISFTDVFQYSQPFLQTFFCIAMYSGWNQTSIQKHIHLKYKTICICTFFFCFLIIYNNIINLPYFLFPL